MRPTLFSLARLVSRFAFAIVLIGLCVSLAEACPGCKAALENDPDPMRSARGYFWSILFMMSMPFAILGTFGTYIYLELRRAHSDKAEASPDDESR